MSIKTLKDKLKNNKFSLGTWLTLPNTSIAEILCDADFDWITIDMEHSAIDLYQAQQLIQIISLKGKSPLVRIGENNPNLIKRCMDSGATGVIVAMVNTKEEAAKAVSAAKYPPHGNRGVGLARAQGYGFGFEEYKAWSQDQGIVIAQIEHIDAINNLEDILSIEGIDGTMIGPYDLSGSLGYPGDFGRTDVKEAIKKYEKICKSLNKPMGFHVVQPDLKSAIQYKEKGYAFLAVGLDTLYLGHKSREITKGLYR